MHFTKTPADFESYQADILYSFQADTPQDVVAKVINNSTQKIIGTKRFVGVTDGVINISPYLKAITKLSSQSGGTGFFNSLYRCFSVSVNVNGVISQPRMFTSTSAIGTKPIVSSMSRKRYITSGEYDEITILTKRPTTIIVLAYADKTTSADTYQQSISGFALFRLNPNDFVEANKIVVIVGGVEEIEYIVRPIPNKATRIAWVGSKGTLEQYTFPIERGIEVPNASEYKLNSTIKTPPKLKTILSSYEPSETITALAEIIDAKQVWRVKYGKFIPIRVEEKKSIVKKYGSLCNMEIVISEK